MKQLLHQITNKGRCVSLQVPLFTLEEMNIPIVRGQCDDEIRIYDGFGRATYTLCGIIDQLHRSFSSAGQTMIVRLIADEFSTSTGFRARWTTVNYGRFSGS